MITEWRPILPSEIEGFLGGYSDWILAGGRSLSLLVGETYREHGDTDIAVFRDQLCELLVGIRPDKVFLAQGGDLVPWDGGSILEQINSLWISDGKFWRLQVLIFDLQEGSVKYRRDSRIQWDIGEHELTAQGVRILNPMVTFLFKANQTELASKDALDIQKLISWQSKV